MSPGLKTRTNHRRSLCRQGKIGKKFDAGEGRAIESPKQAGGRRKPVADVVEDKLETGSKDDDETTPTSDGVVWNKRVMSVLGAVRVRICRVKVMREWWRRRCLEVPLPLRSCASLKLSGWLSGGRRGGGGRKRKIS